MRVSNSALLAFSCILMVGACAGGKAGKAGAAAKQPIGQSGASTTYEASGLPGWVNRGSAAINTEGRRMFFGVGAAQGIANPALLRTTSDNRARAEIAKVMETYSASLMKDYQASSGEQQVEQAIKTFASAAMEGVDVLDRYIDGQGTMYSLAALDLERALREVRAAKDAGIVKTHVEKVSVDDIFDAMSKKPAAPPPPPRMASEEAESRGGAASGQKPSAESSAKARARTGKRPDWVDGFDPAFAPREYLCGVGFASERSAAENAAFAALSRIFEVKVQSVTEDFMGAYQKTGAPSLEVQSSENLTRTSTKKVLTGVEIPEIWQDGRTTYALACLHRPRAARILREQITAAEQTAQRHLQSAQGATGAEKLRQLSQALSALAQRENHNAELRIVDADGIGAKGDLSLVDVAMALQSTQEALAVGVQADGPYAGDFRGALIEALTKRGYRVSVHSPGDGASFDVVIVATIRMEDGGKGTGSAAKLHFARGVVQVEVRNVGQNQIIASMNENRKEGHRSKDEAERLVVRRLGTRISDQVGGRIDSAMRGN